MALRICKLETACHVPNRYRNEAAVVDHFARGRFAADLASHLGPSLARQPAIVRIKQLRIRVILPASQLNEASLSRAWTQAFGRALFTALAYPTGTGPVEVFRADSVETFIAGAIRDLLDGRAIGSWQYAEFDELFRSGVNAAAIALLTNWPELTLAILFELECLGALEKMLPRFDDLALERLFVTLASVADNEPPPLTIPDLIVVAKLVLRWPPHRLSALRARGFALQLHVRARMAGEPVRSPHALFHLLTALAILLSDDLSLVASAIRGEAGGRELPRATIDLLQSVAREVHFAQQSLQLSELGQLLSDLRSALKIPAPAPASAAARWLSSDWCGLFFLTKTLVRLGWITAWRQLPDFEAGGISPLLAGIALTITGQFEVPLNALDPGVALFSGYFADPELRHLNKVFQDYPLELRRKVMHAAFGSEESCETWARAFERLANRLLLAFGSDIRGFQKSSPRAITRTFLQRPGRIHIQKGCITIQPQPSAFHVALHIAGMDAAVDSVSWLGGRRLEFEIGDL
jgi:hypothetical protein